MARQGCQRVVIGGDSQPCARAAIFPLTIHDYDATAEAYHPDPHTVLEGSCIPGNRLLSYLEGESMFQPDILGITFVSSLCCASPCT
jgi:hypothetical protein